MLKHIYIVFVPWYPDNMCQCDAETHIYIYCEIQLDSSTGLVGAVLKSKCDLIIQQFLRCFLIFVRGFLGGGFTWQLGLALAAIMPNLPLKRMI